MLLAFTDESYSEDRYFQAAFVIRDDQQTSVTTLMNEAKLFAAKFGVVEETEFHGYPMMNHVDGWEPLEGKLKAKLSIYKNCLNKIAKTGGVIIVQGVDTKRVKLQYDFPYPPEQISHKHLLDALDRYAESQNQMMIVYSDVAPQQKVLGELFLEYKVKSTGGHYPRKLKQIERVEYIDSKSHIGIQIADLIAYLYRRMEDHYKDNEYEQRRVKKLWLLLEPCIHPWYPPRIWP